MESPDPEPHRRLLANPAPIDPRTPGSSMRSRASSDPADPLDAIVLGLRRPSWRARGFRAILGRWPLFRYDPAILERYPGVVGGVIHATGVTNGRTPPGLAEAFIATQATVRARIGDQPLSEIPSLAAWRRVFRAFGVDPTQYRSAAEALLRRLTKQGELPSIGTLVDLANLVSIGHALPVAVFDLRSVTGWYDRALRHAATSHGPISARARPNGRRPAR